MKAIKSIFSSVIYVKVEYVKTDNEKYHVYKKDGYFGAWVFRCPFKTLSAAEEYAKSRAESVVYLGLFENGVRKEPDELENNEEIKKVMEDLPSNAEVKFDGFVL